MDRLDPDEKETLAAFALAEAETTHDQRFRAFLMEFPKAMGLRDEE